MSTAIQLNVDSYLHHCLTNACKQPTSSSFIQLHDSIPLWSKENCRGVRSAVFERFRTLLHEIPLNIFKCSLLGFYIRKAIDQKILYQREVQGSTVGSNSLMPANCRHKLPNWLNESNELKCNISYMTT